MSHSTRFDSFHEECGVFGVAGSGEAAKFTALGLHALQHRGQEAAGIVSTDGSNFYSHRALGLVGDNFSSAAVLERLKGRAAIGHNRYSTSGETMLRNVQPIFAEMKFGGVAIAHNGNLTNAMHLRQELVGRGCIFQSTMDTEVIIHLIAISKGETILDKVRDALSKVEGAYSLLVMTDKEIIAVRDPYGVRPLVLGKIGDSYVVASESCAFDIIGADFLREVENGEMIILKEGGMESASLSDNRRDKRFCVFEYIYFSRPDSFVEGRSVYEARKNIGIELARESAVEADIVAPVPDSGVPAALGYAEASGIHFDYGIIRNHYVGRTFIEPTDQIRHLGVRLKHNANRSVIEGKRVILVDDSIVRGTTSRKIVNMIRDAGAKEVHMRIASPPTTHSCFYGVDTPEREQLLASRHNVEEMRRIIEADSLAFISIDGLYRAMGLKGRSQNKFCDACFTGDYPIPLKDNHNGVKVRSRTLIKEGR